MFDGVGAALEQRPDNVRKQTALPCGERTFQAESIAQAKAPHRSAAQVCPRNTRRRAWLERWSAWGTYDVSWGQRSPSARSGRMRILKRTLDFIPSMKRNNGEFCAEQ